jgi:hypothetical protein
MRIERSEAGRPGEFEALNDDELERALCRRTTPISVRAWLSAQSVGCGLVLIAHATIKGAQWLTIPKAN